MKTAFPMSESSCASQGHTLRRTYDRIPCTCNSGHDAHVEYAIATLAAAEKFGRTGRKRALLSLLAPAYGRPSHSTCPGPGHCPLDLPCTNHSARSRDYAFPADDRSFDDLCPRYLLAASSLTLLPAVTAPLLASLELPANRSILAEMVAATLRLSDTPSMLRPPSYTAA